MIAAKADPSEMSGSINATVGNYEARELKGYFNLPVSDTFAVRLAGHYQERDGYIDNIFTGKDIDDRDMYGVRLSMTWEPTDRTSINFMAQHFDEDDKRARSQKQACNRDPDGVLGCLPTGELTYGPTNGAATITGELFGLAGVLLNGSIATLNEFGYGLTPPGFYPADDFANTVTPQDPRETSLDWSPVYKAEETILTLEINHDFGNMTLTSVTGWHDPEVYSEEDYEKAVATESWAAQMQALYTLSQVPALPYAARDLLVGTPAEGVIPFVVELAPGLGRALYAGNPDLATYADGVPLLLPDGSYQSFDYTIGYDQSTSDPEQFTQELRLASDFSGNLNFMLGGFYMDYESEAHYVVRSTALALLGQTLLFANFGDPDDPQDEANPYMQGYDNDTRKYELESWAVFGELYWDISDRLTSTIGLRYSDEKKKAKQRTCYLTFLDCGPIDPEGQNGYFYPEYDDNEVTWKVNLTYDVNDDLMVYGTVSSSYKSGGFNPISDSDQLVIDDPDNARFEPETVDAFEVGFKSTLLDRTMQLNGTFFFYDYGDLQVSKIVDVTSLNTNTDAEIMGAEVELLWAPTENLQFDFTGSWLDTEIKNFEDYDTADPKGDGSTDGFISCNANLFLATSPNGCGAGRIPGVLQSFKGNQLSQSPEFSFNVGARYRVPMGGLGLTVATNFYWQDSFYVRNNNALHDKVDSWDVWNARARLSPNDERWYAEAWIKNILDNDYVVQQYLSTQVSGLFTNQFLLDPQTYGLTVGFNW
jgi:outer membrane receptor protein involved in Fe transport